MVGRRSPGARSLDREAGKEGRERPSCRIRRHSRPCPKKVEGIPVDLEEVVVDADRLEPTTLFPAQSFALKL